MLKRGGFDGGWHKEVERKGREGERERRGGVESNPNPNVITRKDTGKEKLRQ